MRLSATRLTAVASAIRRTFAAAFSPSSLFSAGEQGVWYDPSDMSTMFQDVAGTTPVTAVEQPVGLILDKSRGRVLGPELVTNGDFSDGTTGWTGIRSTLSATSGALVVTGTATFPGVWQAFSTVAGRIYKVTFDIVSMGTATQIRFTPKKGTGDAGDAIGIIDYTTAGTKTAYFFATGSTSTFFVLAQQNAVVNFTLDNISVRELPGTHAFQATATSRPVLQQDASGRYYLSFDGVDDWMRTNSIDFTSTDKMTVFAGVRKLSDAPRGIILELNDGTVGSNMTVTLNAAATSTLVGAFAPFANYEITVHGASEQGVADYASYLTTNAFAAPVTSVLTGAVDIALKSTASAALRANSLIPARQSGSFTGTAMSGNLPNAPLFIGRRGGASLPFNGRIYSLIIRGAQSTAQQIASAEAWVNTKTGAY